MVVNSKPEISGFDLVQARCILKSFCQEIQRIRRFGKQEQIIYERIRIFLELPVEELDQRFDQLRQEYPVDEALEKTGSPFSYSMFFRILDENLESAKLMQPYEEIILQLATLLEFKGLCKSATTIRHLFHLDNPDRTIDPKKFERLMELSRYQGLPDDEVSFLNLMARSDWREEYHRFCMSHETTELQIRLQKAMGYSEISQSFLKGFEEEYRQKRGPERLYQAGRFSACCLLVILGYILFYLGVSSYFLSGNLINLSISVCFGLIYTFSSSYVLRRIFVTSGLSNKDNFMEEMLKSYNLKWIRWQDLSEAQKFRFMNIYFNERMRLRGRDIKARITFLGKTINSKTKADLWNSVLNTSKHLLALAMYREFQRHSDLLENEANPRAYRIHQIRDVQQRANALIEKARRIAGDRNSSGDLNWKQSEEQIEGILHNFQNQIQLTLDYANALEELEDQSEPEMVLRPPNL